MKDVSDRFLQTVRTSRTEIHRVELYRRFEKLAEDVPVIGGKIDDDSQAVIRCRANLSLPPTDEVLAWLPREVPEKTGLWPLGNEVKVWSGFEYPDGTEELVPQGVFRISRVQLSDTDGDLSINLEGWDRARAVQRARFTVPYRVKQGLFYTEAIEMLLRSRLPWLREEDFQFPYSPYKTPNLIFTSDDDPMKKAHEMAGSIGMELLFDGHGRPIMRPEPTVGPGSSTFDYVEGEDCTLTSLDRDLDDEEAYNGVIFTGETASNVTPARGEAWDREDPSSPTWYDPEDPEASFYGAVAAFMTSEYVTTNAQAQAAAEANLERFLGIIESIQFTAFNNFAQESSDVVTVTRQRSGVDDRYILEALTKGLGEDTDMSGVTRRRRASLVEARG